MAAAAKRRLSKSQYLRGLQCLKSLWLHNFRPDLRTPPSPGLRHVFDQGRKVGELARKRFPGGRLIAADHEHIPEALKETEAALQREANIIFEAAFVSDDVLVRPDVLLRTGQSWDLIEVKSSAEIKEVHLPDVAVQRHVLEGAGLAIGKAFLMHVNAGYARQGDIDPKKYFKLADVTGAAEPHLKQVPARLKAMQAALASEDMPDIPIGAHCTAPYECDFMGFCWKHVPDYSVYDLKRAGFDNINELRGRGVMRIEDIPADFALTETQDIQVRVAKTGKPHIDGVGIKECLDQLLCPLHFLDFETVAPAIPPYDGLRPFQAVPFQASLHLQDKPRGPIRHLDYLGDPKSDPRPGLVEFLVKNVGPQGSIVVYNASFEGGRLGELALVYPRHAAALQSMKKRLWDLIVPFRRNLFVHPDMQGSASMKAVLPALVPGMSYENLAISDGETAFLAYEALREGRITGTRAKKTMAALREYCGQDTLGMVEVLKVLRQHAI